MALCYRNWGTLSKTGSSLLRKRSRSLHTCSLIHSHCELWRITALHRLIGSEKKNYRKDLCGLPNPFFLRASVKSPLPEVRGITARSSFPHLLPCSRAWPPSERGCCLLDLWRLIFLVQSIPSPGVQHEQTWFFIELSLRMLSPVASGP